VKSDQSIRKPRQDRSRRTLEAVLDAVEALIAERGVDVLKLGDIAARAGYTTGAIYARFRDKEALLEQLYDRFVRRAMEAMDEGYAALTAAGVDLAAALTLWVRMLIAHQRQNWSLHNAFLTRIQTEERYRLRSRELTLHAAWVLRQVMEPHRDRIAHDDLDRAAGMAVLIMHAAIERAITLREPASVYLPTSDDALVAELVGVLRAYWETPQAGA
jgi:AcrR family transcriptional regulator